MVVLAVCVYILVCYLGGYEVLRVYVFIYEMNPCVHREHLYCYVYKLRSSHRCPTHVRCV